MFDSSPLNAIPESRDERWHVLSRLIADWYPDSTTDAGVPENAMLTAGTRLGVSIPAALREWYTRFGLRSDVWSRQDELLTPDSLHLNSAHLTFLVENQAVVEWGIAVEHLTDDDPPVYVTSVDDQRTWLLDSTTTSMFALQRFAYCLKFSRSLRWFANAYVSPAVREAWGQSFFSRVDFATRMENTGGNDFAPDCPPNLLRCCYGSFGPL